MGQVQMTMFKFHYTINTTEVQKCRYVKYYIFCSEYSILCAGSLLTQG
jgi:hypothetical protein